MNPAARWSTKKIAILLGIVFLSAALRLYHLDKYPLQYDESISVLEERGLGRLPGFSKLRDSSYTIKNSDYLSMYTLGFVYYWQKVFGKSELALRISSVIFSILSICLFYILARKMFGAGVAQAGAFLLSISPLHIHYAQELRPYAAVGLFALVSIYAASRITDNKGRFYWFIYIVANILGIYFHYMTLLLLLSTFIFIAYGLRNDIRAFKKMVGAHAIILALLAPLLITLYHNLVFVFTHDIPHASSEFPVWTARVITLESLFFALKNISIGYNVDYYSFAGKSAAIVYFLLFCLAVFKWHREKNMRLLLICLILPLFLLFFISKIKDCYVDRYSFAISALYFLIVSTALTRLGRKLFVASISLIILLNIIGLKEYFSNRLPEDILQHTAVVERQDIREAVSIVSDNYSPGDRIIHTSRNTVFPLKFYLRNSGDSLTGEIARGTVAFLSGGKILTCDYDGMHPVTFLEYDFKEVKDFEGINRLWLIFSDWRFRAIERKDYALINKIKESLGEIKRLKYPDVEIYLFERK